MSVRGVMLIHPSDAHRKKIIKYELSGFFYFWRTALSVMSNGIYGGYRPMKE